MKPLLVVLNPRRIPQVIEALNHLDIPQARLQGMTERGVANNWREVTSEARGKGFTHLCVVSDDVIVTRHALASVLKAAAHGVATGWCNLDEGDVRVNLSDTPLKHRVPRESSYEFPTVYDVLTGPHLRRTYFTGMCLTTMRVSEWEQYPFDPYDTPGYASDYNLSWMLQADEIPVHAPRDGFVKHLKKTWNEPDRTEGRELVMDGERIVWR